MTVDWGHAVQIGGFGFGFVFAVLIILALAIWLSGLLIHKISAGRAEATTNNKKKGD